MKEIIIKIYYRILQWRRNDHWVVPPPGKLKKLENRKYLTRDGIKESKELSYKDKYELNIII